MMEDQIADAIKKDYEAATRQARVPPPELVWMRAQLRAREEAARKAARPIVFAQAVGVAAFAGLLVSVVSRLPFAQLPDIPLPLVELVLGGWLVLAPIAVYLAFSRE
jgi:formate-dependent nitrite reductase membrane component NrfD